MSTPGSISSASNYDPTGGCVRATGPDRELAAFIGSALAAVDSLARRAAAHERADIAELASAASLLLHDARRATRQARTLD